MVACWTLRRNPRTHCCSLLTFPGQHSQANDRQQATDGAADATEEPNNTPGLGQVQSFSTTLAQQPCDSKHTSERTSNACVEMGST